MASAAALETERISSDEWRGGDPRTVAKIHIARSVGRYHRSPGGELRARTAEISTINTIRRRRPDQPVGAQRGHRGGAGRRVGPRLRGGGRRGAQAR